MNSSLEPIEEEEEETGFYKAQAPLERWYGSPPESYNGNGKLFSLQELAFTRDAEGNQYIGIKRILTDSRGLYEGNKYSKADISTIKQNNSKIMKTVSRRYGGKTKKHRRSHTRRHKRRNTNKRRRNTRRRSTRRRN